MTEALMIQPGPMTFPLAPPRQRFELSPQAKADEGDEVREQVTQFIGGTFFQMMLKSMRRTVPGDGLISGGRGEEVFRDYMDQELAQRMARTANFPLIDATVRQLTSAADGERGLRAYRQQMPKRFDDPSMIAAPKIVLARGNQG